MRLTLGLCWRNGRRRWIKGMLVMQLPALWQWGITRLSKVVSFIINASEQECWNVVELALLLVFPPFLCSFRSTLRHRLGCQSLSDW